MKPSLLVSIMLLATLAAPPAHAQRAKPTRGAPATFRVDTRTHRPLVTHFGPRQKKTVQATGLDKQSAKAYQKRATRLSKTTDRLAGATIALNLGVFGVFLSRMTTGHPKLDAAIYYGGTGLALVSTAVTYILGYRADILKEKAGVLRAGEHVVVGQQGRP